VAGAFCGLGGVFLTEIPSCLAGPLAGLGYHIIVASRGLPNQHLELTAARYFASRRGRAYLQQESAAPLAGARLQLKCGPLGRDQTSLPKRELHARYTPLQGRL
jgi:hypothetical protein